MFILKELMKEKMPIAQRSVTSSIKQLDLPSLARLRPVPRSVGFVLSETSLQPLHPSNNSHQKAMTERSKIARNGRAECATCRTDN